MKKATPWSLWSNEITFGEAARVAAAPPPDLRSAFRPTYNLAVNLVARFDRETADEVLHRSFAQWQARKPDLLTRQLGHRLAVLERAGLRRRLEPDPAGRRLSRIYHEADLLMAEALGSDVLAGAEPVGAGGGAVVGRLRAPAGPADRRPGSGHGRERGPPRKSASSCRTVWATSARPSWPGGARPWRPWPSASGPSRRRTWCPGPASRLPGWPPRWPRGSGGPRSRPRWPWRPATPASWPRATSCGR